MTGNGRMGMRTKDQYAPDTGQKDGLLKSCISMKPICMVLL